MQEKGQLAMRNKKRKNLSLQELNVFRIRLDIVGELIEILSLMKFDCINIENIRNQVTALVKGIPDCWIMTDQIMNDVQLEFRRLRHMVSFQ